MKVQESIKFIVSESYDWIICKVDDECYFDGHSIPNDIWINLIKIANQSDNRSLKISWEQVTDNEMEMMC